MSPRHASFRKSFPSAVLEAIPLRRRSLGLGGSGRLVAVALALVLGTPALADTPRAAEPADNDPLAKVRLLAVAPGAGRAVVRVGDEPLRVVEVGDEVAGATVDQVRDDRLVLIESGPAGEATVWLFVARRGEASRRERIAPAARAASPLQPAPPVEPSAAAVVFVPGRGAVPAREVVKGSAEAGKPASAPAAGGSGGGR